MAILNSVLNCSWLAKKSGKTWWVMKEITVFYCTSHNVGALSGLTMLDHPVFHITIRKLVHVGHRRTITADHAAQTGWLSVEAAREAMENQQADAHQTGKREGWQRVRIRVKRSDEMGKGKRIVNGACVEPEAKEESRARSDELLFTLWRRHGDPQHTVSLPSINRKNHHTAIGCAIYVSAYTGTALPTASFLIEISVGSSPHFAR